MKLSVKIFLMICLPILVLGLIFGIFLFEDFFEEKSFKENQIHSIGKSTETQLTSLKDELKILLNLVAGSSGFDDSVRSEDFEPLYLTLSSVYEANSYHSWVLNKKFEVLARGHDEFKFGDTAEVFKIQSNRLHLIFVEGQYQIVVRTKIDLNFGNYASLIIGIPISQAFKKLIKIPDSIAWNLNIGNSLIASSCQNACLFESTSPVQQFRVLEGTNTALLSLAHQNNFLEYYLFRLVFILSIMLIVLGAAIYASRRLVITSLRNPLDQFILRMEGYEEHLDNPNKSEYTSSEFKRLDDAFVTMLSDIKEKKSQIQNNLTDLKSQKKKLDMENNLMKVLCHDISNPIMSIYLALRTLKKKHLTEKNSSVIQKIENANVSIKNILDHVKEMKAIESGRKKLELVPANFDEILASSNDIFEERLKEKKLRIEFIDRRKPVDLDYYAMVEPISFQNSVLNNILSNAIKFSDEDRAISIVMDKHPNHLSVTIMNKGIPLPQEKEESIFVYEGQTTTQGTGGEAGTGFGMPVARTYMEFYGGGISAFTRDGKTCFELTFPLMKFEVREVS